jgi:hypothetical protein
METGQWDSFLDRLEAILPECIAYLKRNGCSEDEIKVILNLSFQFGDFSFDSKMSESHFNMQAKKRVVDIYEKIKDKITLVNLEKFGTSRR